MSNYIKVFEGSFVQVQHIFQSLEAQNISAIIKDEAESGRIAGFGGAIHDFQEIHVHKDEIKEATKIVAHLISEMEA
ncbi:Putative signal transducing protein [Hyunsoonleella jejuensis]|uniref:Putative signal transducing protein n=1 Tax=Hyunsoonleella jejuensis TaxID=419940 RepID=A0A1H9KE22_9FLAO|nr:DUF2007 domain-containing protein [Hyunsoonleella jejuensis]SEQ97394.1 Putative signal transducing protein [Hyunsoonleella jejuensis]